MKGTILLSYNENTHQVEEEEKARFLREILLSCFADAPLVLAQIEEIWNVDGPLLASQKVKLRGILATYDIQVIDDLDGHLKVYLKDELMAEWFKCIYKLKKDLQVTDPRRRIFLEMEVNYWSIFEEQPEIEQETE